MTVEIRSAMPEDALAIAIVNVYTWKTAYAGLLPDTVLDARVAGLRDTACSIRERIACGSCYLVATDGGTVIGFCAYGVGRNDAFPGTGEIYALYTLKGYHGQGVGRRLFEAAADALRAEGYRGLLVNCLRGNPALEFYRRMGGTTVAERTDELLGVCMTEDILRFER